MTQEPFREPTQQSTPAQPEVIKTDQPNFQPTPTQTKRSIPIKWIVIGGIIVGILVLLYFFRGLFIAATIDGTPISRLTIIQQLEQQSGAQVLDSLIGRTLIIQEATEQGITISDEELETELTAIRENLEAQGTDLDTALGAQGITLEQLKDDLRIQKLAESIVADQAMITEEEIDVYMEQNADFLPPVETEEEQRAIVSNMLQQQKLTTAFQEWLTATKAEANISYWKEY